jgi:hypothetical protein
MSQNILNKPSATVQAGGIWDSINGGLNDALNVWAKVETVKGAKAASGQDVIQARTTPELANGAAVAVDYPLQSPMNNKAKTIEFAGLTMNKNMVYATGGILLALALYGRVR